MPASPPAPAFSPRRANAIRNGAIENIPDELWEQVLAVNLHGVFKTIQAAVPHLKKRGGGRIIVTTSTAATKTSPMVGTPYLATKGAAAHLVRQLALELARYKITVNAIQPGPFQTRIAFPELVPVFAAGSPMHRIGRPEEIEGVGIVSCFRFVVLSSPARNTTSTAASLLGPRRLDEGRK